MQAVYQTTWTTGKNMWPSLLDIIEYRDINLETISISDRFGFNRNIDISRYRKFDQVSQYRDVFPSWDILHPIDLE